MPLYEYECRNCGRRVEKIQKFSDAPLTVCPHCGGALERTITAAAVSFKGGGWYKDLYSSAKPAASGGAGGEAGSGAAKSEGSGSGSGGGSSDSASSTSTPAAAPASGSSTSSGSGGSAAGSSSPGTKSGA